VIAAITQVGVKLARTPACFDKTPRGRVVGEQPLEITNSKGDELHFSPSNNGDRSILIFLLGNTIPNLHRTRPTTRLESLCVLPVPIFAIYFLSPPTGSRPCNTINFHSSDRHMGDRKCASCTYRGRFVTISFQCR
jgi:hypothetical protein